MKNDLSQLSDEAAARLERGGQLFIGGEFCESESGRRAASVDPSSGLPVSSYVLGTAADVDNAVQSARRAFESDEWQRMRPAEREELLHRFASAIEDRRAQIAEIESVDTGMSLKMAYYSISLAVDVVRYMAGWPTKCAGDTIPIGFPDSDDEFFAYTLREAVGVVAAIVPWNAPAELAIWKIAPALAAGCTVVLKPPEDASLTATLIAESAVDAGVPAGVLNVVTGLGGEVGEALVAHCDVDKIAFTGSTETGKRIHAASSKHLARVSLELGGKSPTIVFADADIDEAVNGAGFAAYSLSGQVCVAGSRLYVQSDVYDDFVDRIVAYADALKSGPGLEGDELLVGPLVSERQLKRVCVYIESALDQGATVSTGGNRIEADGYYVRPTVISDVRPDMKVMREEIFGPVLCVARFDTVDEVIEMANDTNYGLAAYIWSKNVSTVHTVSRRLRCGKVIVNYAGAPYPGLAEGGFKESGIGRDLGREGFEQYLELKSVMLRI